MSGTVFSFTFRLDGVIQLIHEYTNKPITEKIPRIIINCQAEIIRKENGIYVFLNASEEVIQVRVELPQFLPETTVITKPFSGKSKIVRCTPDPRYISGMQLLETTYFSGISDSGEYVYLMCSVKYCRLKNPTLLEDERVLIESRNFLDADTGRWVRLESASGKTALVQTAIDSAYEPRRYFVTDRAWETIEVIKRTDPVFCARSDRKGRYVIAVPYADDGEYSLLDRNGVIRYSAPYRAGEWTTVKTLQEEI